MAHRYDDILAAGARLVAISIDSPQQNAALIEKLDLPFAVLSDPDRSAAIAPYDAVDHDDPREIARPAVMIIDTNGDEVFREVSDDFADRMTEDEIVAAIADLGASAAQQPAIETVDPQPGDNAMPVHAMPPYYRGAKFAAVAMNKRHPEIEDDVERFKAQLDRFLDAVKALKAKQESSAS